MKTGFSRQCRSVWVLGLLLLAPAAARSQNQDKQVSDGMGQLLHGDKRSVDEALTLGIANAELRRDVSAILDFFRPRDSRLQQRDKSTGLEPASYPARMSGSFSALNASMTASTLQDLRLYIHSAMKATAKKFGLDACPFHSAAKATAGSTVAGQGRSPN